MLHLNNTQNKSLEQFLIQALIKLSIQVEFEVHYVGDSVVLVGFYTINNDKGMLCRTIKAYLHTFKQIIDETSIFLSIPLFISQ